jgi:hypothetical protein
MTCRFTLSGDLDPEVAGDVGPRYMDIPTTGVGERKTGSYLVAPMVPVRAGVSVRTPIRCNRISICI